MEWRKIMSKYKLVALFGESGSGKDYAIKELLQTTFGQEYLSRVVSYTTRPPREGETPGVQYHFLASPQEFFEKELIEYANFNDWYYGSAIDNLKEDKVNIGIYDIKRIAQISQHSEVECYPIYIKTSDKTRLIRQLEREENPNCDEIIRRFIADKKDYIPIVFKTIDFDFATINNDSNNRIVLLNDIISFIKENVLPDEDIIV